MVLLRRFGWKPFEKTASASIRVKGSRSNRMLRYRAEKVGSLLRHPELLEERTDQAEGRLSLEQLRSTEDAAITASMEKQRQIGIDLVTDGELRRGSWLTDMADAVQGFVPHRVELEWKGPGGGREGSTALAAGARLKKLRKLAAHELPLL